MLVDIATVLVLPAAALLYWLVLKPLWIWCDKKRGWRYVLTPFKALGMVGMVIVLFPVVLLFEWLPAWWERVRRHQRIKHE